MRLKDYVWAYKGGECYNYLALNRLINKRETGILQQVRKAEEPILEKGDELLRQFRAKGKITDAYQSFYNWVDQYIQKEYTNIARSHQIRID